MNISQMIYDIIISYYVKGDSIYSTGIRTCLRGTEGPVSQKYSHFYYFGKHKEIAMLAINKHIDYLVIRKLIKKIEDGHRYKYEPVSMSNMQYRYVKINEISNR